VGQKGYRKLENYIRKIVETDYWVRVAPTTTREEIEAMDLDRERDRDALAEYVIVERVIAHRDELLRGRQYMVKCAYSPMFVFPLSADDLTSFQGRDFHMNTVHGNLAT
jgi:hypothetical protein